LIGKSCNIDMLFAHNPQAKGPSWLLSPPRGMRRTYQDLGRRAEGREGRAQAICGHETDEMSELYSTVRPAEMAKAVARIAASVRAA
jgi:integrase